MSAFLISELAPALFGAWREWRRRLPGNVSVPRPRLAFANPRDRRMLVAFVIRSTLFLMLSAVGSYKAYHVTESVECCGETCHTKMKPELTTHNLGPHTRVAGVECHVGAGGSWFVLAKISGSHQLYAVEFC